ncbi:MAG: C40 family peptidase [Lachnospiraceae bacterium]|nr:C40 family peptidase [Lachnospiraceae bacterium]
MKKRICCVLMAGVIGALSMFGLPVSVMATKKTDAQDQKKEAENKLNSVNEDIDELSENKEALEEELATFDAELVDLLLTVDIIEEDINNKKLEIDQATADYEAAKQKEQEQLEAMKRRIKFMYEKGDMSYFELLIKSQSISELVNKSDYVEKLYAYDRKLLDNYQQTKEEVYALKTSLESEMTDLEELHADYEEQSRTLQSMIDEKRESIEGFDEQLASAQQKANEYKEEIKQQTAVIKQIEAEEEAARKAEEARKKAEEEARKKAEEEAKKKAEEEAKNKDSGQSSDSGDQNNEESHEEGSGEEQKNYDNSPGNSSKGQEIANYALQFVGNPYVPGGTSLTEGCDCSGFTQGVYSHFGISIPRNSSSQSVAGREVSYESAQPGDIIYYGGHVGIYIGNGQIVHASTPATGIRVTNALYRSVISVRRFV